MVSHRQRKGRLVAEVTFDHVTKTYPDGTTAVAGLTLDISDDGVGFDPSLRGRGGFGLPGMRERLERLAGGLRIEQAIGRSASSIRQ